MLNYVQLLYQIHLVLELVSELFFQEISKHLHHEEEIKCFMKVILQATD